MHQFSQHAQLDKIFPQLSNFVSFTILLTLGSVWDPRELVEVAQGAMRRLWAGLVPESLKVRLGEAADGR